MRVLSRYHSSFFHRGLLGTTRWLALLTLWPLGCSYPIGGLRCCNTLARPDDLSQCTSKIGRGTICPKRRNYVCVLERIPAFGVDECGKSDSGDFGTWQNFQRNDGTFSTFPLWPFRWDESHEECVYRKCAAACPDGNSAPGAQVTGSNEFEYEGGIYKREWFCCDDKDMCNGTTASGRYTTSALLVTLLLSYALTL